MPDEYRQLADFRYYVRQFLHFSDRAARSISIEPQQHQLLLTVKGLPVDMRPTVRSLAERMSLRHNSTVELVDRLAKRGFLAKRQAEADRREVLVEITSAGEAVLQQLSVLHLTELRTAGPSLLHALQGILHASEQV